MGAETRPADPAAQWIAANPGSRARRGRRGVRWAIAAVVVALLAVGAWLLGEQVARGIVAGVVREQIVKQLELPADQRIDVEIAGSVLTQLIAGRLDELTVSSDDVSLGGITGDMVVHAKGVPTRGGGDLASADARLTLDQQQLRALLATVDGMPSATVTLAPSQVALTFPLTFLGVDVPVGVSLTPGAQDGRLVLTPTELQIGGTKVSAEELTQRFGPVAGSVLRDWHVCVADSLPAGVTLTGVTVADDALSVAVAVDGRIVNDPALQQKGSCS
ncbi:DUF2993 domain-containing protein [Microbacterium sp.]|uniref:LmeA family phospholipid-binding protein n=1 Tax=Microbacterium sp. TaxID=51671 RepID=UPI0039E31E8E